MGPAKSIYKEIAAERRRQIQNGYTLEHDDKHTDGAIAIAAAAYCLSASGHDSAAIFSPPAPDIWPFGLDEFKPRGGRKDLVRAAALIVAEIERLDRRGT